MKRLLLAAVAVTAMSTAPAHAQQATFNVTASVTATCSFTGGTIPFGTLNTNSDGTLTTGQSHSSPDQTGFYCNGAHTTLDLAHTAMTNNDVATATSPFTRTIDFTPAVKVGGSDVQVGNGTGTVLGATAGTLVVDARNLSTASASDKVLAGSYSGTITLTLHPSV